MPAQSDAGWETAVHKGGGAQDTQVQRIGAETRRWSGGAVAGYQKHWEQHSVTFDSELLIRTKGGGDISDPCGRRSETLHGWQKKNNKKKPHV